VVLDKDAGSWFIMDSSVVGYDGDRNLVVRGRCSMERKTKSGWKPWKPPPEKQDRRDRWGLRGKTAWDWLDLMIVPVMSAGRGSCLAWDICNLVLVEALAIWQLFARVLVYHQIFSHLCSDCVFPSVVALRICLPCRKHLATSPDRAHIWYNTSISRLPYYARCCATTT
jgi:hypothetical protein